MVGGGPTQLLASMTTVPSYATVVTGEPNWARASVVITPRVAPSSLTAWEGNYSTSLSFGTTASSGETTVLTLLMLLMVTTWFETFVEHVMCVVAMEAGDASRMTSRTLLLEQEISGTVIDEACVMVGGSTSEVTTGGLPTRGIPNTEFISFALVHNLSRYHNNISLIDMKSHSGRSTVGMASSPMERMNQA